MTWNKATTIAWAALSLGLGSLQAPASAQDQNPILRENAAEKLTDHVYMISGFPNVVIVVGKTGTLVVDTGLGPKNGAVAARTAAKLSKGSKLFLTTTHFHPDTCRWRRWIPQRHRFNSCPSAHKKRLSATMARRCSASRSDEKGTTLCLIPRCLKA